MTMETTRMLRADAVSVTIGRKRLLDRVSVEVPQGRLLGILGHNGAGKSTLLALLSGERRPSEGAVRLDGHELAAIPPAALARRRALVTQSPSYGFAFTVIEMLVLATEAGGGSVRERQAIAEECLARVGVAHLRDHPVTVLSGGERQRVAFGRALAQLAAGGESDPYLLLDEPTASLDPAHQHTLLAETRAWVARSGGGAAVVLHDVTLAARYCDDLILLAEGRKVWGGPAAALPLNALNAVFGTPFDRVPFATVDGWIYAATGWAGGFVG